MNWQNVHTLVTGAGGFIGSHLVEQLVARGAAVRAFVRYNSRGETGLLAILPEEVRRKVDIVHGDLLDASAVRDSVRDCEYIFHLGALISIPHSYKMPRGVVQTNVIGTLNVLEAARECRSARVIHTSTSEVYGTALQVPISERHPLQGQSPYSASKIAADKIVESYFCAFDLPVVTVRPFNTYGPRQSARAIVPTIITQMLRSECVRLGSLEPTRDLTFVDDTVRGFLLAAEAADVAGHIFNLGYGAEISIAELIGLIADVMGRAVNVVTEQQRTRPPRSEVMRLRSDNSLAREELGWVPQVLLRDGLALTADWIQSHLDFYTGEGYQI